MPRSTKLRGGKYTTEDNNLAITHAPELILGGFFAVPTTQKTFPYRSSHSSISLRSV